MSDRGIEMPPSTRPTRGEKRREASRVHTESATQGPEEPTTTNDRTEDTSAAAAAQTTPSQEKKVPAMTLPVKTKPIKRPFATQIVAETAIRLDWVRRQGHSLTDTVDEAINTYLDAAGVPRFDINGNPIDTP